MLNYLDVINEVGTVYLSSNTLEEADALHAALTRLQREVLLGSPNPENKKKAESLRWRALAKLCAIRYFCGGYLEENWTDLKACLDRGDAALLQLAIPRVTQTYQRLREVATVVHEVMQSAAEMILQVRDDEGRLATSSVELLLATRDAFEKKAERVRALGDTSALFDVASLYGIAAQTLNPAALALADLTEVTSWAEKMLYQLKEKETESFFRDFTSPLENEEGAKRFTFYQSFESRAGMTAKTVVLSSPLWDEVVLFVRGCVKDGSQGFLVMRASGFAGKTRGFLDLLLETLTKKGSNLLVSGLSDYRDDNKPYLLEQLMRYSVTGPNVFLVDQKGDGALYAECYDIAKRAEGLCGMDVSYKYLLLPSYREVVDELTERNLLDGEEYDELRRDMAFMGYVGLNEILARVAHGKRWKDVAKEISRAHAAESLIYRANIPTLDQFLDAGWQVCDTARSKEKPKKEFDYDTIRVANPENIRIILEQPISLFAKCGMVARYCMLCGDDVSVWADLSTEQKGERLTDASRLVAFLLNNQYSPEVRVVPEEEWTDPKAGGLCCDGGKRILYREKSCKNYTWTVKAVCHECYHGFQHTLENCGWFPWHWEELGVTKNHVNEWKYNTANYRSIGKGYVVYMIQTIEADARTFEEDCFQQSEDVYRTIDLR